MIKLHSRAAADDSRRLEWMVLERGHLCRLTRAGVSFNVRTRHAAVADERALGQLLRRGNWWAIDFVELLYFILHTT